MRLTITIVFLAIIGVHTAMAIEEAKYVAVRKDKDIEIRDYESYILAETIVDGTLESAGNKAFSTLFQYISGNNKANAKVAMTAPVSQAPSSEKIAMTAPVSQQATGNQWVVSFMMPTNYTMKTIPVPTDTAVTLREVPASRVAAIEYSGTWSEKRYLKFKKKLDEWIKKEKLTTTGDAVWARYNSPFALWFLRRNEILIPIEKQETPAEK